MTGASARTTHGVHSAQFKQLRSAPQRGVTDRHQKERLGPQVAGHPQSATGTRGPDQLVEGTCWNRKASRNLVVLRSAGYQPPRELDPPRQLDAGIVRHHQLSWMAGTILGFDVVLAVRPGIIYQLGGTPRALLATSGQKQTHCTLITQLHGSSMTPLANC